ncbi:MAG: hypothetical protein WC641_06955 [Patescibacteria group bacterium]
MNKPNPFKTEKPPEKSTATKSLEKRAREHPEYAKWEERLEKVTASSAEDAMEHLETAPADKLLMEAKLHFFRAAIGSDVWGFSGTGEHLRKPQELAKKYGLDVNTAEQLVQNARQEVENFASRFDHYKFKEVAVKEIDKLESSLAA